MKFNLKQIKCDECEGRRSIYTNRFPFNEGFPVNEMHCVVCPTCSGTGLQKAYVIPEEVLEQVVNAAQMIIMAENNGVNPSHTTGPMLLRGALRHIIAPEEKK